MKKGCTQQTVWRKAGCMPAESPVGFSSVHNRAIMFIISINLLDNNIINISNNEKIK
jgi:hypothetical protein